MISMGSLNPLLGLPDSPPPTALCTTWNQMKLPFQCSKALGILRGESWGKTERFWSYMYQKRKDLSFPVSCRINRKFCILACCSQSSVSLTHSSELLSRGAGSVQQPYDVCVRSGESHHCECKLLSLGMWSHSGYCRMTDSLLATWKGSYAIFPVKCRHF